MNPQDPLAALNPLREPELIGWWPLGPGWWLLIALLIMILAGLAVFLWRRYQRRAYRRQALRQLKSIALVFKQTGNQQSYLESINGLLKATAINAYPRQEVAALSGEPWLQLLNTTMSEKGESHAFPAAFAHASYQAESGALDNEALRHSASLWIGQHEVRK
ncbi:MAG: type II secretory pathway pseudopilin PulG [Alcanivorax sp.]|jgi:type II secretory pathway pseudopilin PulG